ncbi:MAG: hypothetical protein QGH51_02585 [Planctomycetota bacterium]|jgi:hypothetical protein|nr:hypothetical protein [Planctomycetota bacterium]MDP6940890.1 hypothetical protein [Planctomycetota bacterium]
MNDTVRPLPEELEAELRALGNAQAPDELWDRVSLSLMEEVEAPEELWERILPEVVAASQPTTPIFAFPRLAAAAAVLLLVTLSFVTDGFQPTATDSSASLSAHNELRDYYASRVTALSVTPNQLSPSARILAASMGASLEVSR